MTHTIMEVMLASSALGIVDVRSNNESMSGSAIGIYRMPLQTSQKAYLGNTQKTLTLNYG